MITNSFDNKSKPIIQPEDIYEKAESNEKVTIVTFSSFLISYLVDAYKLQLYKTFRSVGDTIFVYSLKLDDKEFFIYKTQIGAAVSGLLMQEVAVSTGSHKFIFFGSSGVLDEDKCRGKIIVPSESYRDEGVSYHYAPASDYIDIKNHKFVDEFLTKQNVPHVVGRIWTTDAFYMETENKINARKDDGCIAVDMEISGLQAVANFCNFELYTMIFPADSLDGVEWDKRELGGDPEHALQIKSFEIGLELAKTLWKMF